MKHLKSYLTALTLVTFFACQQEGEVTPELNAPSTANADGHNTRAVSCDNNMTDDGCNFTSGQHTLTGHLTNEYETLLNNCHTEPLPSNCEWSSSPIQYELFYYSLDGCCYTYSQHNFKVDQIMSMAQSNAPGSNWLVIGYEVNFVTFHPYPPKFQIKAYYKKKGICTLPADRRDFVQ